MPQSGAAQVKILFRFFSEVLEQETVETIWAETVNPSLGHYQLDSIPFYAPGLATDDIVHAEYDDAEEMLTFRELVKASGNSNIWVVIIDDKTMIDDVRDIFFDLECISEALGDRYFALEIKASSNYFRIRDKLNKLKADGIIDYAEACLSDEHQY
jgi:Domain of unknown function (DUF4265)